KIRLKKMSDMSLVFRQQLAQLRGIYRLEPQEFGRDTSQFLHHMRIRGIDVFGIVKELRWKEIVHYNGGTSRMYFRADLGLVVKKSDGTFEEVFTEQITIEFPDDYPKGKPEFHLTKVKEEQERHNFMLNDTRLCVMNDPGDWQEGSNNNFVGCI